MVNSVRLADNLRVLANQKRQLSGFWQDFRIAEKREDPTTGFFHFEKFSPFRTSTNINAAEAYWANGLLAFGDNGAALAALAQQGGGITIGSDGDNEGLSLHQPVPAIVLGRTFKNAYFEARVKVSAITDAKNNFFVGLADTTAFTATVPITAAGALADLNLVGFHRPESARTVAGTGGAIMNAVYKADGVAAVTVQADAATLVADTFIKLGMRYDKELSEFAPDKFTLSFFVDGLKVASKIIPSAAGTDFPNDLQLGLALAILNASGAAPGTASIDWVAMGQDY